jgi:ATP-dependent Clp protease adaptor protein ClpS
VSNSPLFLDKYYTDEFKDERMAVDSKDESKVKEISSIATMIEPPKRYYVVMHNDDTTPFDFVIDVLVELYRHDEQTAADLANKIHIEQKAIVGMYNLEIAEQKIEETVRLSRANGYQLSVSLDQAD